MKKQDLVWFYVLKKKTQNTKQKEKIEVLLVVVIFGWFSPLTLVAYILHHNKQWKWICPIMGFWETSLSCTKDFVANSLVFGLSQWLSGKKNLPAMQETQVWSMGWGDPLEEGMATGSSICAWRIPWTEEPGGLQSIRLQRIRQDWSDFACTHLSLAHGKTNTQ